MFTKIFIYLTPALNESPFKYMPHYLNHKNFLMIYELQR